MPRGEPRRDLIACLRQGNDLRRPRSRGDDLRGQLPDMQSIHVRSPEANDHLVSGYWEADLVKGAYNRSAAGTLVESSIRSLILRACRTLALLPLSMILAQLCNGS